MVVVSFIKLHLLASILNQWMYAARDSFSHCWISRKHMAKVWILALQSFSHNKFFISSQDLSELKASMTNVHVNPFDFALVSLALLSLVRSAAVSMSISHSSSLVESCSLKTVMSCSSELVTFDCFCVVHKVSVYCHITSPKDLVGGGRGGGWSAIKRSCPMQSKVSAGSPSPASTHWCKSFISLVSVGNLLWLLYTGSLGDLLPLVLLRQLWHQSYGCCHCQYLCVLCPLCQDQCLWPRVFLHLHGGQS